MIRALLLILDAGASWEKIAKAQRGYLFILGLHLLPLMAITLGVEAYAMTRLGEGRTVLGQTVAVAVPAAVRYVVAEIVLNLMVVFVSAKVLERITHSFHTSVGYLQCFTAVAYGVSPVFILHLLDALPGINTWVCFGIGIFLSVAALYYSVPFILRPDPAKAMGIYLMMSILLIVLAGLAHFLAIQLLHGQLDLRFWKQFV